MTQLYRPEGMRGDVKFIRGLGNAWGTFKVNRETLAGGAGVFVLDTFDVDFGCLMKDWKLMLENGTEAIPWSCNNGEFTFQKDKKYKVSISKKAMPPLLLAALAGWKVQDGAVATTKVLKQAKVVLTATATPTLAFAAVAAAGDLKKVLSVYRQSDSTWWSQAGVAGAGVDADKTFMLLNTAGAYSIAFQVGGAVQENELFTVVYQYYEQMVAGDLLMFEDGVTFPESVDLVLSWLVKYESGANKGKKGYMIAIAKNCMPTSGLEIGTEAQGIAEDTMEFAVNFMDQGDIKLFQAALA